MKISIFPAQTSSNGFDLYNKLTEFMSKSDTVVKEAYDADAALIWSVLWNGRMSRNKDVWDRYRAKNKPVIVIEIGGLVRDKTWRLSANGINRSAIFPQVNLDTNRPTKLGLKLDPWHNGDYVLICGQHGRSEQWRNLPDMNTYYKQTVLEVRKFTDRPIVIRSHPRFRENLFFKIDKEFFDDYKVEWNSPKQVRNTYDSFDLEYVLKHSHCVISHSSNSGLSAIMAGVPSIVSTESLAYPMGTDQISQIENLPRPDREQWLLELSHKEWVEDELEYAWTNLRNTLNR